MLIQACSIFTASYKYKLYFKLHVIISYLNSTKVYLKVMYPPLWFQTICQYWQKSTSTLCIFSTIQNTTHEYYKSVVHTQLFTGSNVNQCTLLLAVALKFSTARRVYTTLSKQQYTPECTHASKQGRKIPLCQL